MEAAAAVEAGIARAAGASPKRRRANSQCGAESCIKEAKKQDDLKDTLTPSRGHEPSSADPWVLLRTATPRASNTSLGIVHLPVAGETMRARPGPSEPGRPQTHVPT